MTAGMGRDLAKYVEQYEALPFEPIQAAMRRRLVLRQIARRAPRSLLEVGCGHASLLTDVRDIAVTVVEPSAIFADRARAQAAGRTDVQVVQAYLEDFGSAGAPVTPGGHFDMIVVSNVLHEVPDAQAMLGAVSRLCGPHTLVHVSVPNARSLHRLLALSMGLISDPAAISDTQRTMQQRATYEQATLDLELARAGFIVTERGSLFVKPFTHAQMQQLVDGDFMTPAMLDGLDSLVQWLPDLGSEIWVNARAQ
ncbi:MAG TPA: class I SAM-dependent methyltransferase [Burkholderiales bacterium]|nr:class I SAM-dependent methyltransferase [Burkholderiales bacterium]